MAKYMAAHTTFAPIYPGYVNFSRDDDGSVIVIARGDPKIVDGIYICGHASDRGKPGRCTPGDDRCNNYCNMAPEKGKMQNSALPCQQTYCGETVSVRLSPEALADLLSKLSEGE